MCRFSDRGPMKTTLLKKKVTGNPWWWPVPSSQPSAQAGWERWQRFPARAASPESESGKLSEDWGDQNLYFRIWMILWGAPLKRGWAVCEKRFQEVPVQPAPATSQRGPTLGNLTNPRLKAARLPVIAVEHLLGRSTFLPTMTTLLPWFTGLAYTHLKIGTDPHHPSKSWRC